MGGNPLSFVDPEGLMKAGGRQAGQPASIPSYCGIGLEELWRDGFLKGLQGFPVEGVIVGSLSGLRNISQNGLKAAGRSIDELSQAAAAADRGGLTAAGRAIQKHGGREGSAFPPAKGNPSAVNQQGQNIVDDILTTPGSTTTTRHHARFGEVIEVRAPDGRGIRYGADGKIIGLLEP